MAKTDYISLAQKHYAKQKKAANAFLKPENKDYRCFLEGIANYANIINSGFDTLYLNRQSECALHLLRMVIDAISRVYGILLADKPKNYLKYFFKGETTADKCHLKSDKKEILKNSVVLERLELEYPNLKKIYNDSNSYIHPTSFYCLGVDADDATKKILADAHKKDLVNNYGSLRDEKERVWVYKVMDVANDILTEVMWKVVYAIEPIQKAPNAIDINKNLLICIANIVVSK